MGLIRLLPPHVAALVAAGEVVESPRNVVKEAIENSLDAGATRIDVDLLGGGLRSIRVSDDGAGMDADDLALACVRHATSKLATAEDLDRIAQYGFRGEALASIATVARVVFETRRPADESGWRLEVAFGRPGVCTPAMRQPGTSLTVQSLFATTPARLKFLGSPATEAGKVVRAVRDAALARPDVAFRVESDGQVVLDAPAAADTLARIAQVHGDAFARTLMPVHGTRDGVAVEGYVSRPAAAVRQSRRTTWFVNDRPCESPELRRVVRQAFGPQVLPGHVPEAILFITCDAAQVNPNVSPDKSTVRIQAAGRAWAAAHDALLAALADPRHVAEGGAGVVAATSAAPAFHWTAPSAQATDATVEGSPEIAPQADLFLADAMPRTTTGGVAPVELPEHPSEIAQVARTFLVVSTPSGLLVVDQHSADERLRYQAAVDALSRGAVDRQALLFPEPLAIADVEAALWTAELLPVLEELGFETVATGAQSWALTAVPTWSVGRSPTTVVAEALAALRGERELSRGLDDRVVVRERLLKRLACHSAVRAGQPLSEPERRALWSRLRTADLALADIHGRPGALWIGADELARRLLRGGLPG